MNPEAVSAAQSVTDQLTQELGEQLVAVYLYGSTVTQRYLPHHSNINLLAVTRDDTDIHAVRAAFWPVWGSLQPILHHPPSVATVSQLQRHLQLQPLIHQHLATFGQLLSGRNLLPPAPAVSPTELLAYWCQQSLEASPVLAPALLRHGALTRLAERLRRLARQLGCPVTTETDLAAIFAQVQVTLAANLAQLDDEFQWLAEPLADAPPLLTNLQAIYEVEDGLLFIFPDLSLSEWEAVDWTAVTQLLDEQYYNLWVTTAAQFRLALRLERPLYSRLRRFNHLWGHDVLADLPSDRRLLFRQAARLPSGLLIDSLPHAYLSQEENDLHPLLHDFQNQLLNIQLQHELLMRSHQLGPAAPPQPLPDRERPSPERVAAIFYQLDWWADHYTSLMLSAT
jgi:hypothetical protein